MHHIIIQCVADKKAIPKISLLRKWAAKALAKDAEITIRIVDSEEMSTLNATYRNKKGPTNVLSFPSTLPDEIELDVPLLGDIVICADVVNREAQEQKKTQAAHWAHLVVHGVLHLRGYDHEVADDATEMENLEITILQTLGFANPYESGDDKNPYD